MPSLMRVDAHRYIRKRTLKSSSAWLPLVYDTMVLAMILYKTVPQSKGSFLGSINLHKRMWQDGLLYYMYVYILTLGFTTCL
jgi:hypothetical protein